MGTKGDGFRGGELSEDVGPPIFGGFERLGHDPELALRMVNAGDGVASRGTDGPAATEKIHWLVGVAAASAAQRQMEVQQRGIGTRAQDGALFFLGFGAGVVRGEAGGAADGSILAGQLAGQKFLGGGAAWMAAFSQNARSNQPDRKRGGVIISG